MPGFSRNCLLNMSDEDVSRDDQHRALRDFYDGHYYAGLLLPSSPSAHLRRLAARFVQGPNVRVLDVACGSGDWLQAAADRGALVSGIDIARRAVAVAARRLPAGCFATGVAERLPYGNSRFDLVTCLGSLEHFPDKNAALAEMRRVVHKDGRVLVLVPNADFLTRRLGWFRGTEQISVREDVLSLDEWKTLFERNGFQVVRRWGDLHVLSRGWLMRNGWSGLLPRLVQALALLVWPLRWQYQVYHLLLPVTAEP